METRNREKLLLVIAAAGFMSAAHAEEAVDYGKARERMVDDEIVAAGVKNPRVVQSLCDTPRHEFMPMAERVYGDAGTNQLTRIARPGLFGKWKLEKCPGREIGPGFCAKPCMLEPSPRRRRVSAPPHA